MELSYGLKDIKEASDFILKNIKNKILLICGEVGSGKTTLVVKMGPNNAKLYHAIIVFTSLLCFATFIFKMNNPILFLSLIPGLYLIYHLRIVMMISDPKEFDPELKKVALCTFAMCTLFLALISFNH